MTFLSSSSTLLPLLFIFFFIYRPCLLLMSGSGWRRWWAEMRRSQHHQYFIGQSYTQHHKSMERASKLSYLITKRWWCCEALLKRPQIWGSMLKLSWSKAFPRNPTTLACAHCHVIRLRDSTLLLFSTLWTLTLHVARRFNVVRLS